MNLLTRTPCNKNAEKKPEMTSVEIEYPTVLSYGVGVKDAKVTAIRYLLDVSWKRESGKSIQLIPPYDFFPHDENEILISFKNLTY